MATSTINEHKHIVFCIDHYNPLGICRSLGEKGIRVIVILVSKSPSMIPKCKYVEKIHVVCSNEEGLKILTKCYSKEKLKPFVYTGSDGITELLNTNYTLLNNSFFFFNCGMEGKLSYFNNKDIQCKVAGDMGITIPKGVVLKKGELPDELRYPVLTKVTMSTLGAWKKDVFLCREEKELLKAYKSIKASEVLVQEYIEKQNEICLDGFSIDGGREVWLSHTSEYIRYTDKGYGNYMWIKPYNNDEIKKKIKEYIKSIGYSGIFSFELLHGKDGKLYFLEINLRNSGWSYAYTYGGVNLPYYWALSTLDGHIPQTLKMKAKPFKTISEINDFSESVSYGKIKLCVWIWQFLSCDVKLVYNRKDKAPFINYIYQRIKNKLLGK